MKVTTVLSSLAIAALMLVAAIWVARILSVTLGPLAAWWTSRTGSLVVGGVYSIARGDGTYGLAKLLVLDDRTAHVRLYKERFPSRPATGDLSSLTLGSIHDPDGFGIGHLPIARAEFLSWHPRLVVRSTVAADELDGYREWQQANGGVWGQE